MTEKNRIISALGESKLLLPALLNAALAANDQVKYLFTLLQLARDRADHPHTVLPNLLQERIACGLDDEEELDSVVEGSRRDGDEAYRIPHAERILTLIARNIRSMLEPLRGAERVEFDELVQRHQRFLLGCAAAQHDAIAGKTLSAITSADRPAGDSLHLLVIDAHKALNRLQSSIAAETIDGARVYEIKAGDRGLIKAFMRGVNQTAALKFDHPGLGTTATHTEDRLVIQNDIGTTDAHVLVVHVSELRATLTYTDVHLQRLLFFESLFELYHVRWDDTLSRKDGSLEDGVYHLMVGRYEGRTRAELEEYLAYLGSRLVFLIDWNRARKRLRNFLPKERVVQLLKWSADENFGHMAFLKCGGERIVYEALEFVARGAMRLGQRLDEMLGIEAAEQYLKFVVRSCSEGLRQGLAEALIRDEIKAELLNYFRTAQQTLLDMAADHAVLIVELASGLRDALLNAKLPDGVRHIESNAVRAKEWERQADLVVNSGRDAARTGESGLFYRSLLEAADDVADHLEEASFHFTLLPQERWQDRLYDPLIGLAGLVVQGTQEYLKALETTRCLHRGAMREDVQDFLEAVHRISAVEQRADEAQRAVKKAFVREQIGHTLLYVYTEAVKSLERSADALMHAGLMLRDHVLTDVMAK
ncbi:MAG: DUF47 family protein [Burkholderiales bacterium]